MLQKQIHSFRDNLGRTWAFSRWLRLDEQGRLRREGCLPCKTYARQRLDSIVHNSSDDPFHYRLMDLWLTVYQRPWARPISLHKLIDDLAIKIANQELRVYLEDSPLWHVEFSASGHASSAEASPAPEGSDAPRVQGVAPLRASKARAGQFTAGIPPRDRLSSLLPAELAQINSVETFEPLGVTRDDAEEFLRSTEEGREMLRQVTEFAGSGTEPKVILDRAIGFIQSGTKPPGLQTIKAPLVKIVPSGQGVSAYSPFFTTPEQLKLAQQSKRPLSDIFGLPVLSDSARYDVYQITPIGDATVFNSTIASTRELGGKFLTEGGALQVIVPNRKRFTPAERLHSIEDNSR